MSASSYRHLLGQPDVRALLVATCLSRLAARMFSLAIVLYALTRFDSPLLAGWLAFAAVAPGLLISPVAGALIDRVGSVWAIAVDMAASAACVAALIVVDLAGLASVPVLLGITGLYSLTSPLGMAGIRALLPRLVPGEALDRANALDTASHGVADVIGPALAGMLVAFGGSSTALAVIVVLYVLAATYVGRIRQATGAWPRLAPLLVQAWSGFLIVLHRPTLRGLAVSYSLYQIAWGVLIVAVPVFAAEHLAGDAGSVVAGLLWAGLGLVGGAAALLAGSLRTAGRERGVMTVGLVVTALAAWPIAAEFGFAGVALGLMLVGAAAGVIDVGVLTLRQRRTEPAELGRVLSVSMSLNMAGGPLGSALAGILVTWSTSATFAVAALACVLAAAAVGLIPRDDAGR